MSLAGAAATGTDRLYGKTVPATRTATQLPGMPGERCGNEGGGSGAWGAWRPRRGVGTTAQHRRDGIHTLKRSLSRLTRACGLFRGAWFRCLQDRVCVRLLSAWRRTGSSGGGGGGGATPAIPLAGQRKDGHILPACVDGRPAVGRHSGTLSLVNGEKGPAPCKLQVAHMPRPRQALSTRLLHGRWCGKWVPHLGVFQPRLPADCCGLGAGKGCTCSRRESWEGPRNASTCWRIA